MHFHPRITALLLALLATISLTGCATLQQVSTLSKVKFSLDRVSDVQLAGIDLTHVDSPDQLNMFQLARATLALSREDLPLDLTVHLKSENPMANKVAATLTKLEWTLILDGRDTVSGLLDDKVELPAGNATDIPVHLSLNMFQFFDEKPALDMLDLALAIAGENGRMPRGVALRIRPTIDTIFGPITYGREILIEPRKETKPEQRAF